MSPATPQAKLPRYHSLDRLRAIMMLLGLVLHSAINYFPFPDEYLDQIYLDTKSSPFFDYLVKFIHSFRMPVFFVMAGFFAAFLFDTRGAVGFLRHRWQRVGVPLIGAWIVVYPVTAVCSIYANSLSTGRTLSALASGTVSLEHLLSTVLLHLWFLYYLLIYCVIAVLMAPLLLRFRARDGILDAFQHAAPRIYGLIPWVAFTGLVLYPMKHWTFDHGASLIPNPHHLTAYGIFFVYGWLVYLRRSIIPGFKPRAWGYFVAGLGFHGLYLFFWHQGYGDATAVRAHVLAMACIALSIWCLIYGFIGLFLRYMERPSPCWRYISDASYWMYIIHLPITIALPPLLAGYPLPSGVKFSLVLVATTAITLVTYHYLVRGTFIGERLNGRRYPRVVPWREAATTGRAS